jgi:hypothetical protein
VAHVLLDEDAEKLDLVVQLGGIPRRRFLCIRSNAA